MDDKIKDIITRSVINGNELHYTLEEEMYLISEYIFSKKGIRPNFTVGNGMMEMMLLNIAFDVSLKYFISLQAKQKENDRQL